MGPGLPGARWTGVATDGIGIANDLGAREQGGTDDIADDIKKPAVQKAMFKATVAFSVTI